MDSLASKALSQAEKVITGAMDAVGVATKQVPRVRLSPKQQLERFASMTEDDFAELEKRHGPEVMHQYVQAMSRLARGGE